MFRSSMVALSMRVAAMVAWLAFNVSVARLTDTDTFAAVFFIITFAQFGSLAVLMGYNVVVLRHASVLWETRDTGRFAALVAEARRVVFAATVMMAVILLGLHWLGVDSFLTSRFTSILVAVVLSCLVGLMALHMEALRSTGHLFKALTGTSLLRTFGSAVFLIPLVILGLANTQTILSAHILALLVAVGLEWVWIRKLVGRAPPQPLLAPHMKEALSIWPGELSVVLIARASVLVLGFSNDVASIALLIAADRIAMLGQFLSDAVRLAIGPAISVAHHKGSDSLRRAVQNASALMFATGFIGGLGLFVVGWPMLWAFGPQYTSAFPYAVAMLVAQASWTILGPTALIANMTGLGLARSRLTGATAIAMLLVQFVLLKPFGVWGVLGTFVVATWAMNGLLWFEIYRKTGVRSGVFGFSASDLISLARTGFRSLANRIRK